MAQSVPGDRNQCRQPGEGEQQGVGHDDRGRSISLGSIQRTAVHYSPLSWNAGHGKKSETNLIPAPPSGYHLASLISRRLFRGIRAQQRKPRRTLIEAAFSQLCANRSFSNLSPWKGQGGA